jgi:thymidylate synthase ThyX
VTISAKIIADSVGEHGIRITTFELEYPRFIHAEFMTHRMFSRNAASSRAIPVKRAIELIRENTAMPIHWGKNQPGMSAKEECNARMDTHSESTGYSREEWWNESRDMAILHTEAFDKAGYHKQIVNRLLEPYSHIKVVCTATEYDNFFNLRRHPDAQPEIQELAEQMWKARLNSQPISLPISGWHAPYFDDGYWIVNRLNHDGRQIDLRGSTLQQALMISASCCAQVSYRKNDDSLEKAETIYKRLVESKPIHASPFEHQATPIEYGNFAKLVSGVTHFDILNDEKNELHGMTLDSWSGNFRGWVQHRQLLDDHTVWRVS